MWHGVFEGLDRVACGFVNQVLDQLWEEEWFGCGFPQEEAVRPWNRSAFVEPKLTRFLIRHEIDPRCTALSEGRKRAPGIVMDLVLKLARKIRIDVPGQ